MISKNLEYKICLDKWGAYILLVTIQHMTFEIERKDLEMAGTKQDQYTTTFRGFNFMAFYDNDLL